ncbi:MAG TPA: hypothetical protein VG755_44140 [Nannocystaceae bacterium]|nr:hypothetical protein [Nannocystaceae bacterium]
MSPRLATTLFVLACGCGGAAAPSPAPRTKVDGGKAVAPQAKYDGADEVVVAEPSTARAQAPAKVADDADDPNFPTPPRADLRASVYFRKAPQRDRATVWRPSAADPTIGEQLPLVVDHEAGGAVGIGTMTPLLSQNGVWLAYLDRGHLMVAMLDGAMKERITRHGPSQVSVLISGFSPDSATLMFEQHEVQAEDAMPLPADVKAGFTLLKLTGYSAEHLPLLTGFEAWTAGSTRVVLERREGGATELVTYALEDAKVELQQRLPGNYGFTQLVVGAEHIVYVRVPKDHRSQVVRAKLDGSALVELSPEGDFTQYQWPKLSVDGKQVAYRDNTRIVRVSIDGGAQTEVTTCTSGDCEHAWESGTGLLVRDGSELTRHEDGAKTVLATDALGFAIAGEPG